jgi:hypothetical protein
MVNEFAPMFENPELMLPCKASMQVKIPTSANMPMAMMPAVSNERNSCPLILSMAMRMFSFIDFCLQMRIKRINF